MHLQRTIRVLVVLLALGLLTSPGFAATAKSKKRGTSHSRSNARRSSASARLVPVVATRTIVTRSGHHPVTHMSLLARRRAAAFSPWTEPTFADSTAGDLVDGEDLVVRRAAVQALGPYNGTIVVADPQTGRLLSVVNQKLAAKGGFQPCSTIKLVASLAGLNEGVIDSNTLLRVGTGRHAMTLTEAIAHSNNPYFYGVGSKLGFEKIQQYAKLFGLGEKATDMAEEQAGTLPDEGPSEIGMMTVFGTGIYLTPYQLAALVSSIANGGTLYTLQHPKSDEEIAQFVPKVRRQLDIQQWIPVIKPGMMGAVEFGTARRADFDPNDPIFGKTGTCTDTRSATHLGWFGSFNEVGSRKLVVVVLLTGGRPVSGPVASGIAGAVYRTLAEENYFGKMPGVSPLALISNPACCR